MSSALLIMQTHILWKREGSNTNTNAASTKPTTSAGLYSIGWSGFSTSQNFAHAVIAIRD